MNSRLIRLIPLAGVVYAGLSVAGNGSIGDFPDANTPLSKLLPYYATHHAGIARGGLLLHWAAFFFALFAVAMWARVRSSGVHPVVAGAILVGAAVDFAEQLSSAGVYSTLGFIGGKPVIDPAALQAWHVNGSGGGLTTGEGGLALMLLALGAAGVAGALPSWLAWTALPLGILQLTPIGFFAELVFLLWAAAAGIYTAIKPGALSVRSAGVTPVAAST